MSHVTINDMRHARGFDGTVARFEARVDGWRICGCYIVNAKGELKVRFPRTVGPFAHKDTAVIPPELIRNSIRKAGLREYAQFLQGNPLPVVEVEHETCEMAGI